MVHTSNKGAYLINQRDIILADNVEACRKLQNANITLDKKTAKKETIAYQILQKHNTNNINSDILKLKFDCIASHDITYVSIIQTLRAIGVNKFDIPYVLTNCHNSLCAVGGTINEDDHIFGLSAAKKFGGIYVPAHFAVIHQYMREMMAGCGKMLLGSDSHTRYGALGTLAVGEGGGELVKQLIGETYDIKPPEVIAIYLTGKPQPYVGPHDVALAIIREVFKTNYVKNKIVEFIGDGIQSLDMDFRNGIDVMTTEMACLSSIWITDETTKDYYKQHCRKDDFSFLCPGDVAYYDGVVTVDLAKIRPMIALPFHPSNAYTINEFNHNLEDIINITEKNIAEQIGNSQVRINLKDKIVNKRFVVDQCVIAGCAGGSYSNICYAANILEGNSIGSDNLNLSIYPSSQPVMACLTQNGIISKLIESGATIRSCFCGPCFGAGDVPINNGFSIRHSTRNFSYREGAIPAKEQVAYVALMDTKSIAATALNKGNLTSAEDVEISTRIPKYTFNKSIYENRVYNGYGNSKPQNKLIVGPNISDWPEFLPMKKNILLKMICTINDSVTTTDEIIPSGETSSYRSNPVALAEFTLSRKCASYVGEAKKVVTMSRDFINKDLDAELYNVISILDNNEITPENTTIASAIYAVKPGDGSAREQAASCQKVLGGGANIVKEYATKRYRSNLINWGIIPFRIKNDFVFKKNDYIFVQDIYNQLSPKSKEYRATVIRGNSAINIELIIDDMTLEEIEILKSGCLINYYRKLNEKNV